MSSVTVKQKTVFSALCFICVEVLWGYWGNRLHDLAVSKILVYEDLYHGLYEEIIQSMEWHLIWRYLFAIPVVISLVLVTNAIWRKKVVCWGGIFIVHVVAACFAMTIFFQILSEYEHTVMNSLNIRVTRVESQLYDETKMNEKKQSVDAQ
ncbi:MAG TPA: hypothetical protein PJ991_13530 [Kiritimatiellia bacterium]|nr:hypothetical protein [Kiritimatiellia bacterium]